MPESFAFYVRDGTGRPFNSTVLTGDKASFQEACDVVSAAAAGKDEAEIGGLLTAELRARGFRLTPVETRALAAAIAGDPASIKLGAPPEWPLPDIPRPGLVGRLVGSVLSRAIAPAFPAMMDAVIGSVPGPHGTMRQAAEDPNRYVPEPGQAPAPADVITDPDLDERLPLLDGTHRGMPPMPTHAVHTFWFGARLEEDGDMIIVRKSGERIGSLNSRGAEEYAPHLRAARQRGQVVSVTVTGQSKRGRVSHVTVSLAGAPGH
jgi:hypothetical protein